MKIGDLVIARKKYPSYGEINDYKVWMLTGDTRNIGTQAIKGFWGSSELLGPNTERCLTDDCIACTPLTMALIVPNTDQIQEYFNTLGKGDMVWSKI